MKPIYLFLATVPLAFTHPITLHPNTSIVSRTEATTNSEIEPRLPVDDAGHGQLGYAGYFCGISDDFHETCWPDDHPPNALKEINVEKLKRDVMKATGEIDKITASILAIALFLAGLVRVQ